MSFKAFLANGPGFSEDLSCWAKSDLIFLSIAFFLATTVELKIFLSNLPNCFFLEFEQLVLLATLYTNCQTDTSSVAKNAASVF